MKKIINDYENYAIYDNGDVENLTTKKILKGSIGENGYKYYRLSKNGKQSMVYAHRLVAESFIENLENYPIVNHKDGNKLNNNLSNLEWTTYSDNTVQWHKLSSKISTKKEQIKYSGDLEQETWKIIPGYENYRISSQGRVHNLKTNNILRPVLTGGYLRITVSMNGKRKDLFIHKLVYSIFNNDYDFNGYVIDHINGNKLDNNINNLRKVTFSENVKAAYYDQKINSNCKQVGQYNLQGELINIYPSTREAARQLKFDASVISKVCRGDKYKTTGGFVFRYI